MDINDQEYEVDIEFESPMDDQYVKTIKNVV